MLVGEIQQMDGHIDLCNGMWIPEGMDMVQMAGNGFEFEFGFFFPLSFPFLLSSFPQY